MSMGLQTGKSLGGGSRLLAPMSFIGEIQISNDYLVLKGSKVASGMFFFRKLSRIFARSIYHFAPISLKTGPKI